MHVHVSCLVHYSAYLNELCDEPFDSSSQRTEPTKFFLDEDGKLDIKGSFHILLSVLEKIRFDSFFLLTCTDDKIL
jgi:hypothetical protein